MLEVLQIDPQGPQMRVRPSDERVTERDDDGVEALCGYEAGQLERG